MKVTALTRSALASRRQRKRLLAEGYEEVGEGGGKLWELHRGSRTGHHIVDVQIAVGGRSLFVKIEPAPFVPALLPYALIQSTFIASLRNHHG